jgi:signal peptidase I
VKREADDKSGIATRLREIYDTTQPPIMLGRHWVGDLAVEADLDVQGNTGEILLDLVEGGRHHICTIDVATGNASLTMDGGSTPFVDEATGKEILSSNATTAIRGPGKYHVRFSNCDDQLLLWINGGVVVFDSPTTFATRPNCNPAYSDADHLDLAPAGVGTKGAQFSVSGLRILRDIYYIASDSSSTDSSIGKNADELTDIFRSPEKWDESQVFSSRQSHLFLTEADQFYPLGDNSPASMDARSWSGASNHDTPPFVRRELLIGKALVIYWPHAWNRPIPYTPNVQRMGIIR